MNRFLQRAGIVFVVALGLVLAIAALFVWNANRGFERRINSFRVDGKPVSVADLGEAASLRGGTAALRDLKTPMQALELAMSAADETGDPANDRAVRIELFRAFETEQPDLIELLRSGAKESGGAGLLAYDASSRKFLESIYEQVGLYRSAVRALRYHAESELALGRTDEAALDAIAILQWSGKQSHEPCLVSLMSALASRSNGLQIAAQCLYRGDAAEAVRAQLLNAISGYDRVAAWSRTIDSERALGLTLMDELPRVVRISQAVSGENMEYLKLVDQYEALGKQNWGIQPGFTKAGPLVETLGASLQAALQADRRTQAEASAVLILAQWQDKGSDNAMSLADLGLPKPAVTDPFDGSNMKFVMTDDGPVIYSLGADGSDDGGAIESGNDVGIEPAGG